MTAASSTTTDSSVFGHPGLVSVIIRTKDRPATLQRAVDSVAAQVYPDIELLIVNDGSTALSIDPAQYTDRLRSVRLLAPPAPGGRVRAANTGMAHANGEFLIFLDDDDWFYAEHLSKLVHALQQTPSAGLAYTGVECRGRGSGDELELLHVYDQPFDRTFMLVSNFIPIHAAMFRRRLLDTGVAFKEQLDLYEDWDFWLQLLQFTDFIHVPGVSACYYIAAGSGFGLREDAREQAALRQIIDLWRPHWSQQDLSRLFDQTRQLPGLRQELHDTHQKCRDLYGELHDERVRLQEIRQESRRLEQNVEALYRRHRERERVLKHMQWEHALVLNSRSWKLTKPLRWATRKLDALRGRSSLLHAPQNMLEGSQPGSVQAEPAAGKEPVIKPYVLRCISSGQFADAVRSLIFPQHDEPLVSVIIPVYNHLELTLACLQSLHAAPQLNSYEVIVVDDASTDATEQLLSGNPTIRLFHNEENAGFVHTCNKGAEQARGKYLFFLNNDTEALEHWLDPLVGILEQDATAGIAGSKLVYPSGWLQEAGACLRSDGSVELIGLNRDPSDARYCRVREVDHCSGAALLVRAQLFRQAGGFDTAYAPAYYEDCDLSMKVRQAGYRVIYQPESVFIHHLSVSTHHLPDGKMGQINRNKHVYLQRWAGTLRALDKVRLIAFYLPQYHPIPENDAWWGKGFTEWTNVRKAKPLFDGHRQPHVPGELGYYDLRDESVRERQAELARQHGIHGFCYYYYWFNGKRLLERPLLDLLQSGKPDFPFCVCWANENWTRRWDGKDHEVLMAQEYSLESNIRFIRDLLSVLRDPRYIRIDGRPLLLVYRAELITDLAAAILEWRRIISDAGLGEVYLAAVESFHGVEAEAAGLFDALVEFPPHGRAVPYQGKPRGLSAEFTGQLYDYEATAQNFLQRTPLPSALFRTAMPGWDNTARRMQAAHVYLNASEDCYRDWLASLVSEARHMRRGDEKIVFINAWNEWAEGNHLEPDEHHGRAWLEATKDALDELPESAAWSR